MSTATEASCTSMTPLLDRLFAQVTLTNMTMTILLFAMLGLFLVILWQVIQEKDNGIEWWHFVSITKPNGANWGDLDKVIKLIIALTGSWAVVKASHATPPDLTGLSMVLGVFFAFGGGVAYGSAKLRSDTARDLTSKDDK